MSYFKGQKVLLLQVNQKLKMEYRAGPLKSTRDEIRQCLHNYMSEKINDTMQPYIVARGKCNVLQSGSCVCI